MLALSIMAKLFWHQLGNILLSRIPILPPGRAVKVSLRTVVLCISNTKAKFFVNTKTTQTSRLPWAGKFWGINFI